MAICNLDLRRKASYRKRRTKKNNSKNKSKYRNLFTYDDFQKYTKQHPQLDIVQMDTVKRKRSTGKTLLTMLFTKSGIILFFLMPDCKANSVINVFDLITKKIGIQTFRILYPIILTDNGSEFKNIMFLKSDAHGQERCPVFYCYPQVSWQKAELEKNHEYI